VAHAPDEAQPLRSGRAALAGGDAAGAADDAAVAGNADVGERVDADGRNLVGRVPLAEQDLAPIALQPHARVARGPETGRRAVVDIHLALDLKESGEPRAELLAAAEPDVRAVAGDAGAAIEVLSHGRALHFDRFEVHVDGAVDLDRGGGRRNGQRLRRG